MWFVVPFSSGSLAPLKSLYFHWTAICSSSNVFTPRSFFLLFVLLFSGLIVEDLTTAAATSPFSLACRLWNGKKFATSRYQSISIKLSIAIGNRWQSIKGHKDLLHRLVIDYQYQSITDIDWYWLISIVIDYRFHRLDTSGDKWSFKRVKLTDFSLLLHVA